SNLDSLARPAREPREQRIGELGRGCALIGEIAVGGRGETRTAFPQGIATRARTDPNFELGIDLVGPAIAAEIDADADPDARPVRAGRASHADVHRRATAARPRGEALHANFGNLRSAVGGHGIAELRQFVRHGPLERGIFPGARILARRRANGDRPASEQRRLPAGKAGHLDGRDIGGRGTAGDQGERGEAGEGSHGSRTPETHKGCKAPRSDLAPPPMRVPVLVTGGAGYIGSHAVLALLDAGWPVAVIDNLTTGFRFAVPDGVAFYEGDIEDSALLARIFAEQGTRAVMHFAGSIVVPESVENPLKYYHNNTVKSRALIAAAVAAGVPHFIFSSTAATYGIPEVSPVTEGTPKQPINPYGWSKLMT